MKRTLIRRVNPATLDSPLGWNVALQADERMGGWARADIMVPVAGDFGVVFVGGDTLVWNDTGPNIYPPRNSLVQVDRDGNVWWLSGDNPQADPAIPNPSDSTWFWPTGGWAEGHTLVVFGHVMRNVDTDGPWAEVDTAIYRIRLDTPDPHQLAPGLVTLPFGHESGIAWGGTPVRHGGHVYVAGFNNATWQHFLARINLAGGIIRYATPLGWGMDPEPLEIGDAPLGPLNLLKVDGEWLATAFVLSSAPELGYAGTPDICAWTAPFVRGPWTRDVSFCDDASEWGWSSYSGQACRLPGVNGLVALWSQNAPWSTVVQDVDAYAYGPHFEHPEPEWQ